MELKKQVESEPRMENIMEIRGLDRHSYDFSWTTSVL